MRKPRKTVVPAIATLANLTAGCLALALLLEGEKQGLAALLIIAAVLCDSLDGALARMFGASSDFGAELDSLADVVSFGVAPGILVVSLQPDAMRFVGWVVAVCFAASAAWRLARFNVVRLHELEDEGFMGLPTTGAGGVMASAVLCQGVLSGGRFEMGSAILPWLLLLMAFLMVSNIPYPHIGSIIAKRPVAFCGAGLALLALGVVYWEYEIVFLLFFMSYAASGPAIAVGAKIKALRTAHYG